MEQGEGWMERDYADGTKLAVIYARANRGGEIGYRPRYRPSSRKNKRGDESVNTGTRWKRTNKFVINRDTGIGRDRVQSFSGGRELMKFHFLGFRGSSTRDSPHSCLSPITLTTSGWLRETKRGQGRKETFELRAPMIFGEPSFNPLLFPSSFRRILFRPIRLTFERRK